MIKIAHAKNRKKELKDGVYWRQFNIKIEAHLVDRFDEFLDSKQEISRRTIIRDYMQRIVSAEAAVRRDCQFYKDGYCQYDNLRIMCPVPLGKDWDCFAIPKHGAEIEYGIKIKAGHVKSSV